MFDEWRQIRRLRRALREVEKEYAPQLNAAKSGDEYYPLLEAYDAETFRLRTRLERIRTSKARRRAEKFGIELPPLVYEGADSDWEEGNLGGTFLTEKGYAKVNRQVSNARFVYWERWAGILIPILSLLVAIIALLWHGCSWLSTDQ